MHIPPKRLIKHSPLAHAITPQKRRSNSPVPIALTDPRHANFLSNFRCIISHVPVPYSHTRVQEPRERACARIKRIDALPGIQAIDHAYLYRKTRASDSRSFTYHVVCSKTDFTRAVLAHLEFFSHAAEASQTFLLRVHRWNRYTYLVLPGDELFTVYCDSKEWTMTISLAALRCAGFLRLTTLGTSCWVVVDSGCASIENFASVCEWEFCFFGARSLTQLMVYEENNCCSGLPGVWPQVCLLEENFVHWHSSFSERKVKHSWIADIKSRF